MKLINSLKTVCDFLLLISFASLLPAYGKTWVLIVSVLALAFVSTYLLQSIPDIMPLKVLCALLPALGLLTAKNLTEIIITAVMILFYVMIAVKDVIVLLLTPLAMIFHLPAYVVSILSDELYLWMRPDYKHEGNSKEMAVEFGTGAHDLGVVPTFNGKTGDEFAAMIIGAVY